MKSSHFRFPRRVRIHGGECGAVARALHHEAQKNALIPYEWSLLSQAGLGNVPGSTLNERKQMSTKTSIKRIALVAVSALGFGLLSVMPANANTTLTGAVSVGPVRVTFTGAAQDDVSASAVTWTSTSTLLLLILSILRMRH